MPVCSAHVALNAQHLLLQHSKSSEPLTLHIFSPGAASVMPPWKPSAWSQQLTSLRMDFVTFFSWSNPNRCSGCVTRETFTIVFQSSARRSKKRSLKEKARHCSGFLQNTNALNCPCDLSVPIYRWANWGWITCHMPFWKTLKPTLFPLHHTLYTYTCKEYSFFI